jgi:hypothetical protein
MGSLVLIKAIACLVVIVRSLWISLAERSHSSFALVVSCVQVKSFCFFLVMLMRASSGRFKPMRVGLLTGILRLRALMDGILFKGEENVLNMREIAFTNSDLSPAVYFWFQTSFV